MLPFHFKQFSVNHAASAMKVGFDAVLFGAWAPLPNAGQRIPLIVDVGTGCGVVALLTAARHPTAQVIGIEHDGPAAYEAAQNFAQSPYADRMQAIQADALAWQPPRLADAMVCNPPFFELNPSPFSQTKGAARQTARQLDVVAPHALTPHKLMALAARTLAPNGLASFVYPAERLPELSTAAADNGFTLQSALWVRTRPHKAPKRILCAFAHAGHYPTLSVHDIPTLTVATADNQPTEEYTSLLGEFYQRVKA